MRRVEGSTTIEAPPERLWDFFNDVTRWNEWVAFTDEVVEHPDRLEQGAVYRERSRIGPFKQTSDWRITEFEPPRRQVHVGKLPGMEPVLTVLVEPSAEGSRITQITEFEMRPRVIGALLERVRPGCSARGSGKPRTT